MENTQKLIDKLNQLNKQTPKNIIEIELMLGYTVKLYEALLAQKNNSDSTSKVVEVQISKQDEATQATEKYDVTSKIKEKKSEATEPQKEDHNIPSIGDIAKKFVNNIITKINHQEKVQTIQESDEIVTENIEKNIENHNPDETVEKIEEKIILTIDETQEDNKDAISSNKEPDFKSGISFEPPPVPKIIQLTPEMQTEPEIPKSIAEVLPDKPVSAQGFIAPKVEKSKDFKSLIGFNDKILYINELFGKDNNAFNAAIDKLNKMSGFAEAKEWIDDEIAPAYLWDKENKVVESFYTLVEHYFKLG